MQLGEVLNLLARMTSHRWWKEDGIVYVRSLSYEAEHRRDPPALALERWTERARAGTGLGGDDDLARAARRLLEAHGRVLGDEAPLGVRGDALALEDRSDR